jgi:hypothetical protein
MLPLLRRFGLVVTALALAGFSSARATDTPRPLTLRAEGLMAARAELARGDPRLSTADGRSTALAERWRLWTPSLP